jgi:hypothetical protein
MNHASHGPLRPDSMHKVFMLVCLEQNMTVTTVWVEPSPGHDVLTGRKLLIVEWHQSICPITTNSTAAAFSAKRFLWGAFNACYKSVHLGVAPLVSGLVSLLAGRSPFLLVVVSTLSPFLSPFVFPQKKVYLYGVLTPLKGRMPVCSSSIVLCVL